MKMKNPSRIVEIVQESSEKLVEKKLKALLEVRKLLLYEHPESLVVKTLVWEQVKRFQITIFISSAFGIWFRNNFLSVC